MEIPNKVTHIGAQTFEDCSSLTSIRLPNDITYIGKDAFSKCYNLKDLLLNATIPPTFTEKIFSNNSIPNIYVPINNLESYKSSKYWKLYADNIKAKQ